jgi:hypothetical protein
MILRRIYRMLNTELMARTIADQPFDGEDINGWIFRTTVFPSPSTTNQLKKEQKKLNGKNKAQKNG